MSMNISAFRDFALNANLGDNVSIVLNNQTGGLGTVRSGGLFGLFNKSKLTNNSAYQALGNALKTEFKKANGLSDAQCTTSVNRAFTEAFGKNFDLAQAAGKKLTPTMLRTVLNAAQKELRRLTIARPTTLVGRMGQSLSQGGLTPSQPNFGKGQPVAAEAMSLLEKNAFSANEAKSMTKTLTKLKAKLTDLGKSDSTHAANFATLATKIDAKLTELNNLVGDEKNLADNLKANHPLSKANVEKFVSDWHEATLSALRDIGIPKEMVKTFPKDSILKQQPVYKDGVCTNIEKVLPKGADKISKAVGEAVKAWAKQTLEGETLTQFKNATSSQVQGSISMSKRIKSARTAQTEKKEHWQNISKTVSTLTAGGPLKLTSVMTSGANLGGQIYGDERTGGHTSGDKSTTDATNVWRSEFKTSSGKTIFNAVRHGVCSASKLKGQARTEAARSRAEGIAKAAFLSRPDLKALIASGKGTTAETPILFNITNISLLSTVNEPDLITDQRGAFDAINARTKPIALKMADGKTVYIKPTFTMFNFSVNPWRSFSAFMQTNLNNDAFVDFSAHVEDYLQRCTDADRRGVIQKLLFDVRQCVENTKYQRDTSDLYKASSRIAVLSNLIGEVPTFNCKSGKDRTGQNDVEAKFLATLIELKMPLPDLNAPLTPEQTRIYRDIALQSGNLEIQQLNTGLGGFKTANMSANVTRMGGDDDAFMKGVFKGGSGAVSS